MCDQGYWEFLEQQLQEKDKELKQERQVKEELLKRYKKLMQEMCHDCTDGPFIIG